MSLNKVAAMGLEVRLSAVEVTIATLIATLKLQGQLDSAFEDMIIGHLENASNGLVDILHEAEYTSDETVELIRESQVMLQNLYKIQAEVK